MKHLKAFESREDLLSGMRSMGFNPLKGIVIQYVTQDEEEPFNNWIIIGKDEEEIIRMITEHGAISPVPITVRNPTRSMKSIQDVMLHAFKYSDWLLQYWIFDGFEVNPSVTGSVIVRTSGRDPYRTQKIMESYFTNAKDVIMSKLAESWEEELEIIPWPKNKTKNENF